MWTLQCIGLHGVVQEQRRHRVILARCLEKVVAKLQWNALQAWRVTVEAARVRAVALARHRARCSLACQRNAFAKCASSYTLRCVSSCPRPAWSLGCWRLSCAQHARRNSFVM